MDMHNRRDNSRRKRYTKDMGMRLTNDFVFKYVFGREESAPLLLDLVNAVLQDMDFPLVKKLTLKNPTNIRSADWMKETTLDIRAMDESKRQFDVEIQVTMDHSFLHRSLYYWSHLYYQQIDKGTKYHELRPVVCINLLDYIVYPEDPCNHHCFMLSDNKASDRILTDHEVFHIIELQKPSSLSGRLRLWTELIENAGLEGANMDVLISNDKILKIAHQEYERCAQDQELRELAFSRERFQRDWNSRIGYAEEEGLRRGIEKGMEQGIKQGIKRGMKQGMEKGKLAARQETLEETAGRMLQENMDIGLISKITGLTVKQIDALRKKN